jgi:hypothetical protein
MGCLFYLVSYNKLLLFLLFDAQIVPGLAVGNPFNLMSEFFLGVTITILKNIHLLVGTVFLKTVFLD